jgi:hypothetical protein
MRKSKLQSKIYGNNGAPFVSVVRSEKQEALARKAANKKNSCRFCERVFSLKKKGVFRLNLFLLSRGTDDGQ